MNETTEHRSVRSEGGFSLIELLVVLIIVGILMAFAIGSQDGAKKAVKRQDAIVAAQSLQKSVEAFRRDREGRAPSRLAGGGLPADWLGAKGPIDQDVNRPYMLATWPENVRMTARTITSGGATITNLGSYTPATPTSLSVTYEAVSASATAVATTYRITVRDGSDVICTIRNDATMGSETC